VNRLPFRAAGTQKKDMSRGHRALLKKINDGIEHDLRKRNGPQERKKKEEGRGHAEKHDRRSKI
jgi:hypothetical protein